MHFAIAANCTTVEQWRNKTQQQSRVIFACLRRIPRPAVVDVVSKIPSGAFIPWPLIPDGDLVKPLNWKTFKDAPNIPTILGTCRHPSMASENTTERAEDAGDLRHLSYGDEVVRHYRREMALNDDHGGLIDNGPITLEAEQRSRKVNASVYVLEYEFPPNTTRARFDVEEACRDSTDVEQPTGMADILVINAPAPEVFNRRRGINVSGSNLVYDEILAL
ncbi:hypothetical protein AAVH_14844 [Aphelenchoides avenae]|nr:hypothetical protein AAVH_14844 [Aphelenchus avenae]